MAEVIEGFATVFTSYINFLFELNFSDGTSVGGFILATCVLSLLIRFLFRQLHAGSGDARVVVDENNRRNAVVSSIENTMRGG